MIAVIYNTNRCRSALHSHRERIWRNLRMQRVRHSPPNNTSAPSVRYTREVQEALVSWNVDDVTLKKICDGACPLCVVVDRYLCICFPRIPHSCMIRETVLR
jgi:hypothetical protein